MIFFVKQKTAYERRISDWSSDGCSSDLMALTAFLNRPRVAPALLAIACLSALGTALASQYWGGLQPCVLCLYQRYAYGVALAFAGLAFLAAAHELGRRILMFHDRLACASGSAIAGVHVGAGKKSHKTEQGRDRRRR